MSFNLHPKTNFNDFIENSLALRNQYARLLTPFFNANAIRCWKSMIYSLDIAYWKRDKLWEFLNFDLEFNDLINLKKLN